MIQPASPTDESPFRRSLSEQVGKLQEIRPHNLLVIFYQDATGYMVPEDVRTLYQEMRRVGWTRENQVHHLDVLIHTSGGSPEPAYRMAQLLRDGANHLAMLVPENAYSAGTVLSFCADEVRLGDNAGLSPIDITLGSPERPPTGDDPGVQLVSLDYFRSFAVDTRMKTQQALNTLRGGQEAKTDVESQLMVEMVRQVGALNIGRFYRERTVTGEYARVLLEDYMVRDEHNMATLVNGALQKFLYEAPAHEFHMDFHLLRRIGLPVVESSVQESDISRAVVDLLRDAAEAQIVCRPMSEYYSMPFIQAFPLGSSSGGAEHVA